MSDRRAEDDSGTSQLVVYTEGTTIVIEGDQGGMAKISGDKAMWLLEKLAKKVRSVQ